MFLYNYRLIVVMRFVADRKSHQFFIGAPIPISNDGKGLAQTIIKLLHNIGMTDEMVKAGFKGGVYDGAFLNVFINSHILEEFGRNPRDHPVLTLWDHAHIVELIWKVRNGNIFLSEI